MIRVEGLHLKQGAFELKDVNLRVGSGVYAVLMGRTGTGKTSLIEVICGLRPVTGGSIFLDDVDVTSLKPAERGIGYVPQDGALFSTMTVRRQLGFGLEIRKRQKTEIARRVEELGELLNISHLFDRKPAKLSGGETQRVALGRALAIKPSVLLMDEPLSALDEETRYEMYALLKSVQQATGVTVLHITHNHSETKELADQLFVLESGRINKREVEAAGTGGVAGGVGEVVGDDAAVGSCGD